MGARPQDFFPGVGKLGVFGRKSLSGVHGWSPIRFPQKPTRKVVKIMLKFVYWASYCNYYAQNTLQPFQRWGGGQVPPFAHGQIGVLDALGLLRIAIPWLGERPFCALKMGLDKCWIFHRRSGPAPKEYHKLELAALEIFIQSPPLYPNS